MSNINNIITAPVTDPAPNSFIIGANSEENAVIISDYPYGFRLRCKMRYWLEQNKKGTRLVSQTTNPKISGREVWNKPKASTYTEPFHGVMLLKTDENGHVQRHDFTFHHLQKMDARGVWLYDVEKIIDFATEHRAALTARDLEILRQFRDSAYLQNKRAELVYQAKQRQLAANAEAAAA